MSSKINKILLTSLVVASGLMMTGCAAERIVTQKVNVPVKVKLDRQTYNKAMELPRLMFTDEITADNIYEYTIDLQNKYILLRNTFYNTVEVE